ncbi:MAG: divergent polysaccharide deacetylase family protein [Candidatus Cloacimonetes bacterium]|nr:divergent polysaccharide deacetylase family protein [Candidatus Cloacimonadota bacterium]
MAKAGKKRKAENRVKKYKLGKKRVRKSPLAGFLRTTAIVFIVIFIALVIYHFRSTPPIQKVIIGTTSNPKIDLNDVIAEAASSLGVDAKNFTLEKQKNHTYIKLGINHSKWDLVLANSIITGKIESAGGKQLSAIEADNGNYHLLEFSHADNKLPFIIKIYYGKYEASLPEIFLIIDDFGSFNNSLLQEFCELDAEINFAILPNEPYYKEVMEKASESGHDILIHIPMEPIDLKNNNPGKDAILVQYNANKIKSLVREYIKRLPLAIGANNHMGSMATSRADVMRPVLQVLKENDIIFIDSYTSANTVVAEVAESEKMKIWERDMFLDDQKLSDAVLEEKFAKLMDISTRSNQIFVISHCHFKSKLEFAKKFIARAKEAGFKFSAISTLAATKRGINA